MQEQCKWLVIKTLILLWNPKILQENLDFDQRWVVCKVNLDRVAHSAKELVWGPVYINTVLTLWLVVSVLPLLNQANSGGMNQVELGTLSISFMSLILSAIPSYTVVPEPSLGFMSMLWRISVLGEGSPFAMVFHTSKPSMGFSLYTEPPTQN